jgi:hypothetical protein
MKITRCLPLFLLPFVVWGCGGGGGGAFIDSPLAATYRTSFDRGAVVVDDTSLLLFIDKQGHVGAQISSASEVLYAGQGSVINNSVIVSLQAVGSGATGNVLLQGQGTVGDPPVLNITLSGAISANVTATQLAGNEVVLTAGTYNGTLNGEDSGTFQIQVSDGGDVTGTLNSEVNGNALQVVGDVDLDGRIQFGYQSSGDNGVFEGYLFIRPGETAFIANGEWHFDQLDGDWQATKFVAP